MFIVCHFWSMDVMVLEMEDHWSGSRTRPAIGVICGRPDISSFSVSVSSPVSQESEGSLSSL